MKATCIIEMAKDGGFSCYAKEKFDGFALLGYGDSVAETKEDCMEGYQSIREIRAERGLGTPDIEFEWQYDLASFFNYFKFLNVSEVARMAGINESQLRRYKSGAVKAGQQTYDKLYSCIQRIGNELVAARL